MMLEKLLEREIKSIKKDFVVQFGDKADGAIELIGQVKKGEIETGYFYGNIKPKNIIVASTQIGCPSKCRFCELGNKPYYGNLSPDEIFDQISMMLQQAKEYGFDVINLRHKINYAKSGDALFNKFFPEYLEKIAEFYFTHKLSTIFPYGVKPLGIFKDIAKFASNYTEPFQIQISLISTSERYRNALSGIKLASFEEIRDAAFYWRNKNPNGRKVNLSLMMTKDNPLDFNIIKKYFPPELFRIRLRNYVKISIRNYLETMGKEKFNDILNSLKENNYETGNWATPTAIEEKFSLASNVTLKRYYDWISKY
jgi:adenine C2-methylase RlmN of 23S rRNA A2503 and tRNA A37